ncbi:MAG TPA: PEP-CTERM sorting domain-containing protein [Bryobacteraceae bacterium]|nr:PEP-CTERM sorting domain-containing protein [Bryobacteraceae bacterium]
MTKSLLPALVLSLAFVCGVAPQAKASDVSSSIGLYEGPPSFDFTGTDYPLTPAQLVGYFTFTPPSGGPVVGGTISGTFGNNDVVAGAPNTAPVDLYIDNGLIPVAACDDPDFAAGNSGPNYSCDGGSSPTSWTYTLTSSDISNLSTEIAAGQIDLTAVQNFAIAVQLGPSSLYLNVAPEPSSLLLLAGGLAAILGRRLRRP